MYGSKFKPKSSNIVGILNNNSDKIIDELFENSSFLKIRKKMIINKNILINSSNKKELFPKTNFINEGIKIAQKGMGNVLRPSTSKSKELLKFKLDKISR